MTERIQVGMLRDDEVEPLITLAEAIWRAHYPGIIPPEQIEYMLAQRYRPGLIRQTMARGDRWDAARAGTQLVGFAHSYQLSQSDFKLDKLYVHTDWQRHGIGHLLLDHVAARARSRACERLLLRVNRHNAQAIAAYLKYGFNVTTVVVENIGNGYFMDDYIMTKEMT